MRKARSIVLLGAMLATAWLPRQAQADIAYVGSSTIAEHILPDAVPAFTAKTGIRFASIQIQGSGQGIELVLRGQAQLAGASRSLTKDEKRALIRYEIIGYDAVAVAVHRENPVASLSKQQLKAIYTGRISNWKDIGGRDAPIKLITQVWGAGRGQMVEFQQHAMDGEPYRQDRHEVNKQTDQAAAVTVERHAITSVSQAFLRPGMKTVAIEGFTPNVEHVRSGAYLLSRPLILLAPRDTSDEVKRFLEFMLGAEGQAIVARKFVPAR